MDRRDTVADVAHVGRAGESWGQERWVHQFAPERFGIDLVGGGERPIGLEVQTIDAAPVCFKPCTRGECAGLEAGLNPLFESGQFDAVAGADVEAAGGAFRNPTAPRTSRKSAAQMVSPMETNADWRLARSFTPMTVPAGRRPKPGLLRFFVSSVTVQLNSCPSAL